MRAIIIVMSLAGLVSCGQLPRPFEHQADIESELLVLKDRAGIVVAPLAGDLLAGLEPLAPAIAKHLRDLNVPATTRAVNQESRYLQGLVAYNSRAATPDQLVVDWELWDLDGRLIGSYIQQRSFTPVAGPGGRTALINAMAQEAAPKIAALVQEAPVAEARIPGFPGARLVVAPLSSGPGDSTRSLIPALRAELAASGLPVSNQQGPHDLLIQGEIALEPAPGGREEITISWSVAKIQNGEILGQIDQSNQVPAGSLDGPWGATATGIARGAAQGIIDLLNRAARL